MTYYCSDSDYYVRQKIDNLQKVYEYDQKAEFLEKHYDIEVPRYYQFRQENPVPSATFNPMPALQWGAITAAIGGLACFEDRLSGALLGGAVGGFCGLLVGFSPLKNQSNHIDEYGHYLDEIENGLITGKSVEKSPSGTRINGEALRDGVVTPAKQPELERN